MHHCSNEERVRVHEKPAKVLAHALCISNREEVSIKGGGIGENPEDFRTLQVMLVACKNSTKNANRCKTKEEIEAFVASQNFYFDIQRTEVVPSMFEDHKYVQSWPHLGNKEQYHPTLRLS